MLQLKKEEDEEKDEEEEEKQQQQQPQQQQPWQRSCEADSSQEELQSCSCT